METLAARLHRLSQALSDPADETAHPRELTDLPQFEATVAALAAADIPFSTLRQCALGGNWPMACAAFVVLAGHAQRDSITADVLGQLDKLRPWTLLFALRFLAALEAPPPPGAPVARANQWWSENLVIPDEFQEWFELRAAAGAEPGWGDALDAPGRAEFDRMAALLQRIDHPTATALLAQLQAWQASRVDRAFLATVRAIVQHLLAPLAATLVEQRAPAGEQFLFVRSNGRAIEVEFVDPDAEPPAEMRAEAPAAAVTLPAMVLRAVGTSSERDALEARQVEIAAFLAGAEWRRRTEALQAELADPAFWSRPGRALVFARLARIDRIAEAARTAERLRARLRSAGQSVKQELVTRVALQLHLVELGIGDEESGAPIDAIVAVAPALDAAPEAAVWCGKLAIMYQRWAQRRHMQMTVHGDGSAPILEISGFGAWRTLRAESGLHVLEHSDQDEAGRAVARVKVCAGPAEEPRPGEVLAVCTRLIAAAPASNDIVRRYRDGPAPLVRDAVGGWRSGKLEAVLGGDFDLVGVVS